jgi:hypothetical protein
MTKKTAYTKQEKTDLMEVFDRIAPCTLPELVHASGKSKSFVCGGITALRKDEMIYCRQVKHHLHVWFHVGTEPAKGYEHQSKVYIPKKRDALPVAGPRTHQAGTMERMVWKGWAPPARAGAMDAYCLPSRGF